MIASNLDSCFGTGFVKTFRNVTLQVRRGCFGYRRQINILRSDNGRARHLAAIIDLQPLRLYLLRVRTIVPLQLRPYLASLCVALMFVFIGAASATTVNRAQHAAESTAPHEHMLLSDISYLSRAKEETSTKVIARWSEKEIVPYVYIIRI